MGLDSHSADWRLISSVELTKNKLCTTFKKCSGLRRVQTLMRAPQYKKISACRLFALRNPLMRALQFVYFRACRGLFRCKIPEIFRACGGLFAVQNPLMRVQFDFFSRLRQLFPMKNPFMGALHLKKIRACGGLFAMQHHNTKINTRLLDDFWTLFWRFWNLEIGIWSDRNWGSREAGSQKKTLCNW